MAQLEITTLGSVGVRVDGRDVPALSGTKLGLLLAYLAAESPRRIPREQLARLFWPELDSDAARVNLRQALFQLRRHLASAATTLLDTTPRHASLHMQPSVEIDFVQLQRTGPRHEPPGHQSRAEYILGLVQGYRGHFLEPVRALHDLPELSVWAEAQRETHWQTVLGLIEQSLPVLCQEGDPDAAIAEIRRLLTLEPHDPRAHRLLMLAWTVIGDSERALEHHAQLATESTGPLPPLIERTLEEIRALDTPAAPRPRETPAEVQALRPERRRVTVVACQVEVDAASDIEIQRDRIERALAHIDFALLNRHGHVIRSPGPGLVAYFGYPAGREEATVDAVHAAWEALQTIPSGCQLRLAVDSDLIVTGSEAELPDPTGMLTARAQDTARGAPPGTLIVTEAAYQRVSGYFVFRPREDKPGNGYRVTADPGPLDRIEAQAGHGLTPLAGRGRELLQLRAAWETTLRERHPRFLLLQGEAGVGKSRLARSLDQQIRGQARSRFLIKCREDSSRQLLTPVRQALAAWVGQGGMREARQRRFEHAVARVCTTPESGRLLARWLLRPEQGHPLDEELDRDHIIDTLVALVRLRALKGPTLLICDDVHWMDSGTSEFLRRLYQRLHDLPILVTLTARMTFRANWRDLSLDHLRLRGLDEEAAHDLVARLDGEGRLPESLRRELVERGEGIPLFLEELTRFALETTLRGESPGSLPPGLSNLLVARLEQLGPARELAYAAAVVGRDFDTRILSRLQNQPPEVIRRHLGQLTRKGFVEPCGVIDGVRYRFRHALFRQAAYEAMLVSERSTLHGRLADLLQTEARSTGHADDWGRIATHLFHAGRHIEAVAAWLHAGEQAFAHGMLPEAAQYFEDALACLDREFGAADAPGRMAHETLRALGGLGASNLALLGYGSREVNALFARATDNPALHEDPVQHFRILWGLWHGAGSWHGFAEAHRLADEMEQLAEGSGDRLLRIAAHYVQGNTHFWTGQFDRALDHQTRALALYRETDHSALIARHTENPAISARGFMAWTLFFQGNHARAWEEMETACDQAHRLEHHPTEAFVHTFRATLAFFSDDPVGALPAAHRTLAIAREYDYPLWRVAGTTIESWAQTRDGARDATGLLREQVEAMRHIMDGVSTIFLWILLDALRITRADPAERVQTAEQALASCAQRGDHCFRPALMRLHAEALLQQGQGQAAEAWQELDAALRLARDQGNPNIEGEILRDYTRFSQDPAWQHWSTQEQARADHRITPRPPRPTTTTPTRDPA